MKERGEIVELAFSLKAALKGFIVSEPLGDSAKYDRILDVDGKLSRVQIKGTSFTQNGASYQCCVSYGSSEKRAYTKKDCDFVATYIIPRDVWYILPVESLKGKKKIRVRADSSCKYLQYKERWDLFY